MIDFAITATDGSFANFGNLSAQVFSASGMSSPTRAVFSGGENPSTRIDTQEFIEKFGK